jgi:hypothetical protein
MNVRTTTSSHWGEGVEFVYPTIIVPESLENAYIFRAEK